ncbi:hypothetical protein KS4_17520 [Poriferisphaera corsica]|uniref:DUF488 domain-containing protein n=1 Tax=Poriferisphaera corsica TaxID=2528020 RepID=A0A517YTZ6_9BACT|nr:DUF488 domain-containing protein [Poriferisphaera corsica]QDU33696.1 hypothetical protein KS4_17520 [Poriferisphaera corsica]
MLEIAIKRIYDPPAPDDGFRVLIDRLWPRGVSRDAAKLNAWVKELAPSTQLRKWFNHEPEKFASFAKRYTLELEHKEVDAQLLMNKAEPYKVLTLVYGAKDEIHNHANVLQDFLVNL